MKRYRIIYVAIVSILGVLALSISASAQSVYPISGQLRDQQGNVIPGATVIVLSGNLTNVNTATKPGSPLATIYSDPAGTMVINQITNPVTTSGMGQFVAYGVPGSYVIQAYRNGFQLVAPISITTSGTGCTVAGNNGDLQMKAGADCAASHINDTGSQMNASEPIAFVGPRPWIDVTNPTYAGGADPTGTNDSTAAIAAALAVACPGGYTYPPNACNASVYFPRGDYKVTQPTGNNNPVFNNALASGAYLFSDSISPGSINQGAATPPQVTITVSNCSTSVGLGPVFMVGYGASNVTFSNLSIRGCNEAVYNQRGSFVWFNNVWLQAQRLSASPTGAANPGTAPWYHAAYVGEDTLDTWFNGGGLQSFGTGYPSMMLTGDDCGGDPGICPNLVGLLYVTGTQLEGGPVYYLQSSDITGSPPGVWNFTNVVHESGDGPVMVITNTNNAKTYQVGPINLQNFGVADNQAATGYPIVQFSVNDSSNQSGIYGFTSRQSGSGGTSPILQMLYGSTQTANVVVEGCYVACSNAVVDANGNAIGNGVQMMYEGIAATGDITSGYGHLVNTAPGVRGNSSSLGSTFEAIQSGSNFASYGIDAQIGMTFGQTSLPGWQAALGAPANIANGIPEVDLSFANNYPPTNVAGSASNTGGSLPAGTYYVYMVSTTGDCVTSTAAAYSAPSNIAGPFTITGSTGSIALTWTAAITGMGPITGYCEFINSIPQYNSNINSGPNPIISGSGTTSYTLTTGAGNIGAGAFPVYANLGLADEFKPTSTVLSRIGTPKVTAAVPWNPDCIASTLCGAIFEPLPFATDTFARANALTAGPNWGVPAATAGWAQLTILSDSVQPVVGGDPATQPYIGLTMLADQWVQGTVGNFLNGASDSVGVNVRQDNTGANTEYQFECSNGVSEIIKYISGTPTVLAGSGPSCGSGNVLQLIAVGTNLFASINGSQVLTATDSSITSGYPGLEVYGGTGGSLDSFTSFTGGSMTIGRGNTSLFGQQNWWSGEQDFYGAMKFPNLTDGCLETSSHTVTSTGSPCGSGGGGGTNVTVNGGASLPSPANFENGGAVNGISINITNPSAGNVQAAISGTLADAGLANAYSGVGTASAHQFATALTRNAAPTFTQPTLADIAPGTAASGTYNFSGGSLTLPQGSTFTSSSSNNIGIATTAGNFHVYLLADSVLPFAYSTGSWVNGDCAKIYVNSGQLGVADNGAACGSGGSSIFTSYQFGSQTAITGTGNYLQTTYPSIFSLAQTGSGTSGSPYVDAISLASQTANYFFAAPNGSSGAPTFRAMVAADVPTLNQSTTGSAASLAATSTCTTGQKSSGINTSGIAQDCTAKLGTAYGGTNQDSSAATGIPQIVAGTWTFPSTVAPTYGGTGQNSSSATGVPQISSGTWSFSTTLAAGLTWNGNVIGNTYGGTGQNSSASTGLPYVNAGTWAFSNTIPAAAILASGVTATTQTTGDNTTKVATDAFVNASITAAPYVPETLSSAALTGQTATAVNGSNFVAQSAGVGGRTASGTTDTILCDSGTTVRDRTTLITYTSASGATITVPQAGSSGCGNNFTFAVAIGSGASGNFVFTPTTSTLTIVTGSTATSGATSLTLTVGQFCTISSPDNTNYVARCTTGSGGGGGSGCTISSGSQYQVVTVNVSTTGCTPANVKVDSALNSVVIPAPSSLTTGTVTTGKLACMVASNTVGNCTATSPNNFLGVFVNSNGGFQSAGFASVTLDSSTSVTYGDILCASGSSAGTAHDNGSTSCTVGLWVGIVQTTATSVTSASAILRLQ